MESNEEHSMASLGLMQEVRAPFSGFPVSNVSFLNHRKVLYISFNLLPVNHLAVYRSVHFRSRY